MAGGRNRRYMWSPLLILLLVTIEIPPCLSLQLTTGNTTQWQLKFASKAKYLGTTGSEVQAENSSASSPSNVDSGPVTSGGGGELGIRKRRKLLFTGFGYQAPGADRPIPNGIKVDLMHRNHIHSPLRAPDWNQTETSDRILQDVKRSSLRSEILFGSRRTTTTANEPVGGERTASALDNFQSPLSATLAEYVMTISLGTPARKMIAVVDTGSDLVWVQCAPCAQCFRQPDPLFNPADSTSYRSLSCADPMCSSLGYNMQSCSSSSCQYSYAYGDSSISTGDFATETITLQLTNGGISNVANFAFGCGHRDQGTFSSTDGLVGLGQGRVSFSSQLGFLYGDKFSYCLVSRGRSLTQTSPLLFGDAAVPMVPTGLQYTPMLPNQPGIGTFYYVGLDGISVGGALLSIPPGVFQKDATGNGGTVFDSGTTFTQLVSPAYDAVVRAFQLALPYRQVMGLPSFGLDLCFDIAGVQNVAIPQLTFHFTNADFNLPAENFFVLVSNAGTMCLAISRSKSPINIFGNTQQQNFQILYDRSAARIGFAPLACDSLS
ncbi:hypothetical protein R1flu_002886 [Riccia fluitans]|uniref:Peptidase A1 domain-containing protein n=1 Tax=Riccia fluitans TaxID=41844 RepID=A0ABD1Y7R8_9MARC